MLAFVFKSWDCAKHVRVRAGPPLSGAVIGVEKSHRIFCKLWSVSVVKSGSSVVWFQCGQWCVVLVPSYVSPI